MNWRADDKYFAIGGEAIRSLTRFAFGVLVARWAGADAFAACLVCSGAACAVLFDDLDCCCHVGS